MKENNSFAGLMRYFGFTQTGPKNKTFKKRLEDDNIDYSHFKTNNEGRKFPNKKSIPLEQIMIEGSTYNRGHLKKRLLKNGMLKNECELCGQGGEWNGKELIMVLDHINGVNNDHRLENLRMVCSNCNSQLPTTGGRRKRKINNCKKCGCIILNQSEHCQSCNNKYLERKRIRKVENRPSQEQLLIEVEELGYVGTGRKYGVSDNAIRKWLK